MATGRTTALFSGQTEDAARLVKWHVRVVELACASLRCRQRRPGTHSATRRPPWRLRWARPSRSSSSGLLQGFSSFSEYQLHHPETTAHGCMAPSGAFAGNMASEPSTLLACSRLQRGAGLRCEMSYVLCALSASFSSLMRSFSEEPVASGSIGQIHRAKLSARGALHTGVPPGTEVAVKVCTARCRAACRCNKTADATRPTFLTL